MRGIAIRHLQGPPLCVTSIIQSLSLSIYIYISVCVYVRTYRYSQPRVNLY